MLSIEEYISKRKREDKINEFDAESKMENLRLCVNYVFEYFNQYLDINKMDEMTALNEERLEKYKKQLQLYESGIQEWLVGIYNEYDKQLHRTIINFLKKEPLFLLFNTDQEFREVSYECYAQLAKKNSFLKGQTEMLFLFIKDHQRIHSLPNDNFHTNFISQEINKWVENTWNKFNVNLLAFANDYINFFFDNEGTWPVKHRIKSVDGWRKYEYDFKQKSNLFNIDYGHRNSPPLPSFLPSYAKELTTRCQRIYQ